jgi:hypothetical protein
LDFRETPNKPKQLIQYGRYVYELTKIVDVSLHVRTSVNKFVKGALARNASAELIDRLLETTQLAEESRERRKRVPRRVI